MYNCCRNILMLSRPPLLVIDVATTRCCRDLIFSFIFVATTFSLQAVVATAFDAVLMSRLHPDVATSCFLFFNSWLLIFKFRSLPTHFVFNQAPFTTGVSLMQPEYAFRLLSKPRNIWSFHLYASFLLLSAAANYIITARPHSAPFYCNFCFLLYFLLHNNLTKFIPDSCI